MSSRRSIVILCTFQLATGIALAEEADHPAGQPPLEGGAPASASAEALVTPAAGDDPASASRMEPATERPTSSSPPPMPHDVQGQEADAGGNFDHDAVFRAFAVYAASERDRRLVGAAAGVAAGATTMVLGATIAEPVGTDPTVWYVLGGVTAGLSLLGLLFPSPAELMAKSFRVTDVGHSASEARALEIRWTDYALASKRRRIASGAVSLLVSAVAVGGGIAIGTGSGDFSESDRYFWSTFLIATGAGAGVSGLAGLLVRSPAERSLEAYRAVRPDTARLSPLLVGGSGGVLVGARGAF